MDTLLPLNASAAEQALDELAAAKLAIDLRPIDTNPHTCAVNLLPWLAASWRVDVSDLAVGEQRRLIAAALAIHRYQGTVYAVQQALAAVFADAQVVDEYKKPFHFTAKITLKPELSAIYDANKFARATTLVNTAKNLRSRFGGFDVDLPQARLPLNQSTLATVCVLPHSTLAMHGQTQANIACGMRVSVAMDATLAMAGRTHVNLTGAMQWML